MTKWGKPYLKCEKRAGVLHLTLLGAAVNGHTLKGRAFVPEGDGPALTAKVIEMIETARAGGRVMEKQADGNS